MPCTYILAKEWAIVYVRVCSFSGVYKELGLERSPGEPRSLLPTGRHEVVFVCLALPSITPDCVVVIYGHGLCIPAADRAGAEADSELGDCAQWALVCGRYVCVHIYVRMNVCVSGSVL